MCRTSRRLIDIKQYALRADVENCKHNTKRKKSLSSCVRVPIEIGYFMDIARTGDGKMSFALVDVAFFILHSYSEAAPFLGSSQ